MCFHPGRLIWLHLPINRILKHRPLIELNIGPVVQTHPKHIIPLGHVLQTRYLLAISEESQSTANTDVGMCFVEGEEWLHMEVHT